MGQGCGGMWVWKGQDGAEGRQRHRKYYFEVGAKHADVLIVDGIDRFAA